MKSNNIIKAEDLPGKMTPLEVIKIIQSEIESRRIADGHRGAFTDSVGNLAMQLRFYEMGVAGDVPHDWKKILDKLDPDYDEYLRLKKKFE